MRDNFHLKRWVVLGLVSLLTLPSSIIYSQEPVPAYRARRWERTGGPMGGLGYDIRYKFDAHNILYVTDMFSGIFLSTDRGSTWTPSNTGITARSMRDAIPIFSATVDPHNPNTIWIGSSNTGDIFKSTDCGHTWIEMTNGVDPDLRPLTFRGFTVHPDNPDIVYAMGEISSPGWTPDGAPRQGLETDLTQGIVYRTTDGGKTWKQIWRGDNLARYCWINPHHPNTLYVSTGIFDREAANTDVTTGFAGGVGILKSTDGGETWRVLNQENGLMDLYVGSLFMHPRDPDTLLAAAAQNNWSTYGQDSRGVFLTKDGGEHWERVLADELFGVVEYCTSDPRVAYAISSEAVYRSEDSGQTWQRFNRPSNTWGPPGTVAGIPIDAQCDPVDPMRIIVNNYLGGNFLSTDGGKTWNLSAKGYTGALVDHLAVAQGQPEKIFAGSRSGIYRSNDSGAKWVGLVNPPQGMVGKFNEIRALAVDPSDANHLLTVTKDFETVLYSDDGGQSWQIGDLLPEVSSLVFAPSDFSTVYAATGTGLYVSDDGGTSFQPVGSQQVSGIAIAVHPSEHKTIYISTADAKLLKTTDGGLSTTSIGLGLPSLPAMALAIDPSNPEILFAGINGDGVYRSTNAGHRWKRSSAGMEPNAEVHSISVDSTNGQIVYAGDFLSGVYVSTDGGTTWGAINEGLDHREVNVLSLSADGTVLYVGTEGGGVYRLGGPSVLGSSIGGDVTGDGVVNVQDLKRTIRIMHGLGEEPTEAERSAADLNNDGAINVKDLKLLTGTIRELRKSECSQSKERGVRASPRGQRHE